MRSFATLACLMLLACAACGKVDSSPTPDAMLPENPDGLKSGSRLKLRWANFESTKVYAGLFDSMRQEQCTPRRFADDKTYCIPTTNTVVYRDAGCTMPIGRQFRTCPMTDYTFFTEADPLTCDNLPTKIFPRGAQLSLPTYYTLSYTSAGTTTCFASTTGTTTELYALGSEIPLTDFATLDEVTPSVQGRVQQRYLESSDGARVLIGLFDSELGTECAITLDGARSGGKCVPRSVSVPSYLFGDAGCTLTRVPFRKGCQAPKASAQPGKACFGTPTVPELYQTGAVSTSTLYSTLSGQCAASTAEAGLSYHSLTTTKIEPPAVTRAASATSDQRLRPIYATSGGNQLRDSTLYDSSLKTECTPTILDDGTVRCMPVSPLNYSLYYSDSACTQRLNLIVVPNSPAAGCSLPPLPLTATITSVVTTPTCTVTRDVRPLSTTPYTGSLYRSFLGPCLPEPLTGSTAYLLGDPMPLESFASASLSTEM
jgi:hypothetical protein